MSDDPISVLGPGCQVQIFHGKHDPDNGSPRDVMVIWGPDNKIRWQGPINEQVLNTPGIVIRQANIRIAMSMQRDFRVSYENPLNDEGVHDSPGED